MLHNGAPTTKFCTKKQVLSLTLFPVQEQMTKHRPGRETPNRRIAALV